MTGPPTLPDVTAVKLPSLPRVLSPDEWEHAQLLPPTQLAQAKFPVVPPPFAPRDVTAGLNPKTGKDERANPDAQKLTGPARILTKVVGPMLDHPLTTALSTVAPGATPVFMGLMAKDLTEYGAQKAAELSLSPEDRARAEADPSRKSGEDALITATMLGIAPLIHAVAKQVAAKMPSADAGRAVTDAVLFGPPSGGQPTGEPSLAAQAARKQVEEILRATISPAAPRPLLAPEEAAKLSIAFMRAAKDPNIAPELQQRAADAANTLLPDAPPVTPGGSNLPSRDVRMARTYGAMAARAGDPVSRNPYNPGNAVHDAWNAGHAGVPPEDIGAENVFAAHAASLSPHEAAQLHADLAENANIAASARARDPNAIDYTKPNTDIAAAGGERFSGLPVNAELRAKVDQHMADVKDAFDVMFAPANRSPQAKQAANILRATTGESAARYEQAAFKLDEFRRAIDPLPEADKFAFIDHVEGGTSQANPEFQAPADAIRKILDDGRAAVQALGTGKLEQFIENYFPHIWADPERAAEAFAAAHEQAKITAGGTRPMEGSKAFLKQRTIPTTAEGLRLGLQPVSTNPVDLVLLKVREMQRYVMAHSALAEMKDAELVKFVRAGEGRPDGYQRINDKVATVFGPPTEEGATTIRGEYWAPEPVARIVNNYLSPGLRGNALYDAYRGLGNMLNQAQLGLSGFHLMFTSMDASVSRTALGVEYLTSGKPLTGLGKVMSAPAAPLTNVLFGRKIRAAYLNPEAATPEMQALANAVKEAGGRVRMDSFYKTSAPEQLVKAWREGAYGRATALSLPALIETVNKPLMEHIVPMQKLGVFGDLAKKVLADLPPEASLADRRAALAGAWDSVDNRMGQLVYDNLFWNKTFKDLAMASVRSVGWNIGTIRELGGGMGDLGAAVATTAAGKRAQMTHRAAYVIALPLTVGMYGAVYQYLRTGEGPSETKDYFFPKTGDQDADGNPERVQIASYMKDFFAYAGSPWQTVKHKMHPLLGTVYEMLQNADYYGDQIRNPDDPAVKQLAQEAEFVAKQALPFAIRNMGESQKRGDGPGTQFGQWFGITPAPRDRVRTDAQNRMNEYLALRGHDVSTPEDAEARAARTEILAGLRGTRGIDVGDAVTAAIEHEQLTPKDVVKLLRLAGSTPAQEKFRRLTMPQALDVFKRSTPREQAMFAEALVKKVERAVQAAEGGSGGGS